MAAERKMPDFTSSRRRTHYLTAIGMLSNMGVPLHSINIRAMGRYENYRGEIHSQDPPAGTPVGPGSLVTLEIGVSSLVDYMPYQFFYGLSGMRSSGGGWEDNARSLMAPFDAAVIRYMALMHSYELRYRFGTIDPEYLSRFMDLFEFNLDDGSMGTQDLFLWASVLPSLYQWGGNPEVVSAVLSRLFGRRFRITENVRSRTGIPEGLRYRLGSKTGRLGKETLLGESFEECDSTYLVSVHGVGPAEVADYLPGGAARKRVEKILGYCMPGDLEYRIEVRVARDEARGAASNYLGYSTYI